MVLLLNKKLGRRQLGNLETMLLLHSIPIPLQGETFLLFSVYATLNTLSKVVITHFLAGFTIYA